MMMARRVFEVANFHFEMEALQEGKFARMSAFCEFYGG
jgi:hypothetical protein